MGHIVLAIKNRWPSAWVTKIHGGSYQSAGIPDLLVVVHGRLVALEVKAKKPGESVEHARNRATPTQLSTIAAIRRAGGVAGVVLNTEEACDLVSSALLPKAGDTPERGTLT